MALSVTWPGRGESEDYGWSVTCGRVTGTTVSRWSSPLKSSGLVVNNGKPSAIAVDAIIKSATLALEFPWARRLLAAIRARAEGTARRAGWPASTRRRE